MKILLKWKSQVSNENTLAGESKTMTMVTRKERKMIAKAPSSKQEVLSTKTPKEKNMFLSQTQDS